jgi:hypothetical protein
MGYRYLFTNTIHYGRCVSPSSKLRGFTFEQKGKASNSLANFSLFSLEVMSLKDTLVSITND